MRNGATESDDMDGLRKTRRASTHGVEEAGVEYGTMGDTKRALNEALARRHLQLPSWRERAARYHEQAGTPKTDADDEPLVIL
jgi:hypothetical protein